MPNITFPIDTLGNGAGTNGGAVGGGPVLPQTPVVLSPQQHAVLQALAQHIAANMPTALTPGPSPGGRGEGPAKPRYEVVKHPSAPARVPYAIKDHATGGYVTGSSPHFPRVFSTKAEAQAAVPSQEAVPATPQGETHLPLEGASSLKGGLGGGVPAPRFQVRVNPNAPARTPFGHWDNHAQDWVRDRFGFAQAYGTPAEAHENLLEEMMPAAMQAQIAGMQAHSLATPMSGSAALPTGSPGAGPVFLDAHSGASFRTAQYQAPTQQNNQTRVSQPVKPAQQNQVAPAQDLYDVPQIESNTSIDPSSRQGIVVFVPGTNSNHKTFGKDFIGAVDNVYRPKVNYFFDWDASGTGKGTSSAAASDIQGMGPDKLADEIKALKAKFPGVPVLVIAHSNGGDIAVGAENDNPGLTDLIIRLGSPTMGDFEQLEQNSHSSVIDIYDPRDKVQRGWSVFSGGTKRLVPNQKNWHRISVTAPSSGLFSGIGSHLALPSVDVWDQIQGDLLYFGKLKLFGGRADLADLH